MSSKINIIEQSLVKPTVYIVVGAQESQLSLSEIFTLNGMAVEVFKSAEDFLKTKFKSRATCLIVDVDLPKMDGIALLEHINNLGVRLSTIVLASSGDVSEAVRAMKAHAMDYIEKPFVENTLVRKVLDLVNQPD